MVSYSRALLITIGCVFGDRHFTKGTRSLAGILVTKASSNIAIRLYLIDILLLMEKLPRGLKAIMYIHSPVHSSIVREHFGLLTVAKTRF